MTVYIYVPHRFVQVILFVILRAKENLLHSTFLLNIIINFFIEKYEIYYFNMAQLLAQTMS